MTRLATVVAAAMGVLLLGAVTPPSAVGATPAATTTTATTTTTTPSGPVIDLGSRGQVAFVLLVIGVFAAAWFGLILYDRISANNRLYSLLDRAKGDSPTGGLTADQIKTISLAARSPPRGEAGLTRTTIALGLITLVGIALAALLVGNGANASDLLKTVVTALTTAVTTVVGFYFGAKTASDAAAGGTSGSPTSAQGSTPKVPGAPSNVTATVEDTGIVVTFDAPTADGGSPITFYTATAYGPDDKTVSTTTVAAQSGAAAPIDVGVLSADTYTFTVLATNAVGNGPESERSQPVTLATTTTS